MLKIILILTSKCGEINMSILSFLLRSNLLKMKNEENYCLAHKE